MKRNFIEIVFITAVSVAALCCSKNSADTTIDGGDEDSESSEESEADAEECSMHCDSGDVCNGIALTVCRTIYTITFPLCIEGRIIDCRTPAGSDCCPGYGQEKIDLGPCENSVNYCESEEAPAEIEYDAEVDGDLEPEAEPEAETGDEYLEEAQAETDSEIEEERYEWEEIELDYGEFEKLDFDRQNCTEAPDNCFITCMIDYGPPSPGNHYECGFDADCYISCWQVRD